ncbi:MAG TPA: ATPase, T2SS/T4P/T4SS family [Chloroflexota bacterium]|nr:ATPase, T2SS/T4P/T4SS family [Chloroflexota bacterium]
MVALAEGFATGSGFGALNASDRAAERLIRERVVEAVSRSLGDGRLLAPGGQDEPRVRAIIDDEVAAYDRRAVTTNGPLLIDAEAVRRRLFDSVFGLGILQPLMDDPRVEEIIVNGPLRIFAIRDGRKEQALGVYFETDDELRQLVKRVVSTAGRRLDDASPMVDVRLRDGSRLNAVMPPAATRWTSVTIRKFVLRAQSLHELVGLGALPGAAAEFLDAAVQAGVNILVSGPTGSGKTTLLNALGASIAALDERVVTVEEVPELLLDRQLPDCVALQVRGKNVEGAGEISIRDLVRNSLRMRPTRIIVGEVRGAEALDMLLAMNTGHDGSLTSIHGNSPRDALDRLATLAMMAGERLANEELVRMVSRTIELVVQLRVAVRTGQRRVASIFEVTGLEGGVISGHEVWGLEHGRLVWRGRPPRCLDKMAAHGIEYAPPLGVAAEDLP